MKTILLLLLSTSSIMAAGLVGVPLSGVGGGSGGSATNVYLASTSTIQVNTNSPGNWSVSVVPNTFQPTNYILSSAAYVGAFPTTMSARLLSTNVIICVDGDSRTALNPGPSWPEFLMTNSFFTNRVTYYSNFAIPSTTLANHGMTNLPIIVSHKPGVGQVGYYFEAFGINDVGLGGDPTAIYNQKVTAWTWAKTNGFIVVASTAYAQDSTVIGQHYSTLDIARRYLNNLIRRSTIPDMVVDFDALQKNPFDQAMYKPGDAVHWNDTMNQIAAAYVNQCLSAPTRYIYETSSPEYIPWKADLSLEDAFQAGSFTMHAIDFPGGDGGGTLYFPGNVKVLGTPAAPQSNGRMVWRIPYRMGWTNLDLRIMVGTDSPSGGSGAYYTLRCASSVITTNTATAMTPSAFALNTVTVTNQKTPGFISLATVLPYPDDISPRQLVIDFRSGDGTTSTITNNIYIFGIEASGY